MRKLGAVVGIALAGVGGLFFHLKGKSDDEVAAKEASDQVAQLVASEELILELTKELMSPFMRWSEPLTGIGKNGMWLMKPIGKKRMIPIRCRIGKPWEKKSHRERLPGSFSRTDCRRPFPTLAPDNGSFSPSIGGLSVITTARTRSLLPHRTLSPSQ